MHDIISFLQAKFNTDYSGAINRIEKDIHLMEKISEITPRNDTPTFTFVPDEFKNSQSYWDSYKIPLNVASKYCFLAKSVYKNEVFWGRSTKTNPIFVYKFISGNLKLYRPLADKQKK